MTPRRLREACHAQTKSRPYLANRRRKVGERVRATWRRNWFQPDYPYRQWALKDGPAKPASPAPCSPTGSTPSLRNSRWTASRRFCSGPGPLQRLDAPITGATEEHQPPRFHGHWAGTVGHMAAGNIPNRDVWMSMLLGLLSAFSAIRQVRPRHVVPAPPARPFALRDGTQAGRVSGDCRVARRHRRLGERDFSRSRLCNGHRQRQDAGRDPV